MEKWLTSNKSRNPWLSPRRTIYPTKITRVNPSPRLRVEHNIKYHPCKCQRDKYHYGKPIQLFKDSDRDGVPNVFDCKPRNKRRQDVPVPLAISNPVGEMYGRQEMGRQQREYVKQLEKYEKERNEELQRLSQPLIIDRTVSAAEPYIYDPLTGQWISALSKRGRELTSGGAGISGGEDTGSGSMTSLSSKNFSMPSVSAVSVKTNQSLFLNPNKQLTSGTSRSSGITGAAISGSGSSKGGGIVGSITKAVTSAAKSAVKSAVSSVAPIVSRRK